MRRRNSLLTRRQVLATAAVAPLALSQGASKPNIVYIMADDLGYADVSCYGRRDYKTPNIDSLAADGMKFLQAYANSAVCSATRTALITGRYQYRLPVGLEEPIGSGAKGERNKGVPDDHPTMPSLLRKAGYGTTLIGKWHLGNLPEHSPLKNGYDHYWGLHNGGIDYFTHKYGPADSNTDDLWEDEVPVHENGYMTTLIGNHAVKVISDYAAAKKPFFLSLHFNAPHWPWEGPEDEAESRRVRSLAQFDAGTIKTYAKMVVEMDTQIGRVLQTLKSTGIDGNTIVVFTSDNGGERFSDTWPFTGKKSELLEGGLRIPAIVRWPGHVKPGTESQQVAMSMDWMPTFLEAAGTSPDPGYPMDGISLIPALGGGAAVSRKVYWRFHQSSQRAVRDGDMKFVKIGENTFLFNVVEDPLERANLKARQPEVYQRLVQDYENWNSKMLPEDPRAPTYGFSDRDLADHGVGRRTQ